MVLLAATRIYCEVNSVHPEPVIFLSDFSLAEFSFPWELPIEIQSLVSPWLVEHI